MKIGTASYGGDYVKKVYAKLKDGEQSFRILPPLGDLADKGKWSVFWSVHYGYKNSAGKLRVFKSPLVKNNKKMIEVPDAALDRINALKAEFEKAKKDGKNLELIAKLDKLVGMKGQYNLDSNHYMNAIDSQGNIVILQLRHRAKVALDATIKRLRDAGVDPLSAENGRFFTFRRSGMGLDTTFQVDVLRKKIHVADIGEVEQEVVHKLTPDIISRLSKEAAELDKLYKSPTADEVKRIVAEGSKAVDEILDAKAGVESSSDDEAAEMFEEESTPVVETAPTQIATSASSGPATQVVATTVQAAPAPVATPAPVAAAPAQAATLPPTTAQSIADLSDDDFLKNMGL